MTEASNATTSVPAGIPTPTATLPRTESAAVVVPASQNANTSEYQSAYKWSLPIVQVPRPKPERTKTEYQREFTWKEQSTTASSNASTPIPPADLSRPPSSANINNLAPSRAATPITARPSSSANTNNLAPSRTETPVTPEPPRLLDEVVLPQSTSIAAPLKPAENIRKYNGGFVAEPEDFNVAVERFMKTPAGISTERSNNKWAAGLRGENERKESTLAASLDNKTKNIVALEANRLSKKSRCYSMYSLRDQLKTIEAADELVNPMVSEYKREFVDWGDYGHEVREESAHKRKEEPKLRRRGSWSASLPAPLKWLDGLRNTSESEPREKLQPTISDAKSIRSSNNRSEPKRPLTSAEFRDYHDYDEFSVSGSKHNRLDKNGYYTASHQKGFNNAYPSDNYYPAEERHHYESTRTREPTSYSDRRDREYDDYPTSCGAGLDYNARREPTNRLHDPVYDDIRDYDDHNSDRGYDRSYKDRRPDRYLDERPRDRNYDDRQDPEKIYDNRRSDKTYGDRTRDQYYYDESRREPENDHRSRNRVSQLIEQDRYSERGSHSGSDLDRYSDRGSQFGEHDRYSNHSRNTSYSSQASSLHKGLREELLAHSNTSDNFRSSVSSNSSVSTPSLPSTPREYDTSDPRWKKSPLSDPHIHKDDLYSQALYSKSSQKPWNLEEDRWQGYNQSTRKGFYIDEEDEPIEFNGRSQRQSTYSTPPPLEGSNYRGGPASRGRQMYASPGRSPLASAPRSPTRSPSPSDSSRRYYRGMTSPILSPTYPSRPDSRATSVSSHGTSIEEESAVMIDMLRAADNDLLKSLTQQMSVFRAVREVTPKVGTVPIPGTKKTTNSVKPGLKAATAKSGTTKSKSTPAKTGATTKNVRAAGLPTPGIKRPAIKNPLTNLTKGKKGHKSTSSASSVSSAGSYAGSFSLEDRPNPTSFNNAREALNRARMQVEQMLELVNNGGGFEM